MRLGISLPQCGEAASPDAVRDHAREAEALGYDSVWVLDRVLYPVNPRVPYAGTPDGSLPLSYKRVFDPLTTLTFVAACTERVALGTSVLNLPFYNPVLLHKQLTTLDILSKGRLRVTFGTGWSPDEYEAVGVDMKTRGARTNEALDLLRKMWTETTPEHNGTYFSLPKSVFDLRPVNGPPPVYMAAFTPVTMKRVAEKADGWNPAGMPAAVTKSMWDGILAMAKDAGRDPSKLQLVVRGNLVLNAEATPGERPPFCGTWEEIARDIAETRAIGAHELILELGFLPGAEDARQQLAAIRKLRELAG